MRLGRGSIKLSFSIKFNAKTFLPGIAFKKIVKEQQHRPNQSAEKMGYSLLMENSQLLHLYSVVVGGGGVGGG